MKKTIAITSLIIATVAHADDKTGPTNDDVCRAWGSLAAKIMELRQDEAPLSRALELAGSGEQNEITRNIVMKAYEQPAYQSPNNQKRAVDTFRNQIELGCFKSAIK